jgi:ParB/RepB/Spo0J family partition protein
MVDLSELHESPLNPRTYYAEGPLQELADSIKVFGVRTALVGRPRLEGGGIEIGAGHRRYRAAKRAGIAAVPVIVRDMGDLEFLDMLAFENGNREDLHPLEEAAGWYTWMRKTLSDVPALIAKTGHKLGYVYGRLKLLDAIEEAQQACWEEKIKPGHLLLIARCAPKDQRKALKACEPPSWGPDRPMISTRELAAWIKQNLNIDLAEAPFSLIAEDLVPEAGSCVACPHRSGNLPDFSPGEDFPSICARPECYDNKLIAHIEREKVRLSAEGELILISENHGPRDEMLRPGEWREVAGAAGKPALMVEGGRKGFVLRVVVQQERLQPIAEPPAPARKPAPGLSAEEKKRESARLKKERDEAAARNRKLAEDREREREAAQQKIEAEQAVRSKIVAAILPKVKWPPQREDVLSLLVDIQLPPELDDALLSVGINAANWGRNSAAELSDTNLARLIVLIAVADDFDGAWAFGRGCDDLNAAAKRYGVNPAEFRKPAKAPDGSTRREVIKELPAMAAPPAAKKPAAKKPAAPAKKAPAKKAAAKKKGGKK